MLPAKLYQRLALFDVLDQGLCRIALTTTTESPLTARTCEPAAMARITLEELK